jgi:hypothetical protein
MVIAVHSVPKRQAQCAMCPMKIVIEDLQANECIPGGVPFGKRMGLTGERIEPIAQRAVEPFHLHGPGWSHPWSQHSTDLHRQEAPMLISMLDGLRQRHVSGTTYGLTRVGFLEKKVREKEEIDKQGKNF